MTHQPVVTSENRASTPKADADFASDAVVSFNVMADGSLEILSRYGDNEWCLPARAFPPSTPNSNRRMKFSDIHNRDFVEPLKLTLNRYIQDGRDGFKKPSGSNVVKNFRHLKLFLNFLTSIHVDTLSDVTAFVGTRYVAHCKASPGIKGHRISPVSLAQRLIPVSLLHEKLRDTPYAFAHPWPDSSASSLSGYEFRPAGKTSIIPDSVISVMMKAAVNDALTPAPNINRMRRITACALIILLTTGLRAHELLSLKVGCRLIKHDDEGTRQHWIKGQSYKTHAGTVEWLCPQICHNAIDVLERLQRATKKHIGADTYLFTPYKNAASNAPISVSAINSRLKNYITSLGLNWSFSTHQCRRTFAVYVVKNALGDLRYLRQHFKHWSIDMTALYAANEQMDHQLIDELFVAMRDEKTSVVSHWLDPDTQIAGGMADRIRIFRSGSDAVRTYSSHAEMVSSVSCSISLRATGVAWCTADHTGCNGGSAMDRSRCGDCSNAVIDDTHAPLWRAIYRQQRELLQLGDIGEAGKHSAERALARCETVLAELGADIQALKQEGNDADKNATG